MARLLAPNPPAFAVLIRPESGVDAAEILLGDLVEVENLADLPEPGQNTNNQNTDTTSGAAELPVLAVVPFRQIRERGFQLSTTVFPCWR